MRFYRLCFLLFAVTLCLTAGANAQNPRIYVSRAASASETLAAREVSRYLYLRTGEMPAISRAIDAVHKNTIIVARKDRDLTRLSGLNRALLAEIAALKAQSYLLKTLIDKGGRKTHLIIGGDDTGVLYGAYRFAEHLGVRFYLHGDVVPDERISASLPAINEIGAPLFEVRGIQPFHDFPDGPDWWNRDDYLAIISQLPKLRMNFIGFHCYPEGISGPEPGVWIGASGDFDEQGRVKFSYPSRWANTAIPVRWGYAGLKTSEFSGGAGALFEADDFGPEVMHGLGSAPRTPETSNLLFNRVGGLFGEAFSQARALGVKVALGTETPLTIPKPVQERLIRAGKNPNDPATVREVYRSIFERISRTHPLDYYWLWTPENWIWGGNKPGQFEATTQDITLALEALQQSGAPFTLATSGWVLGPQGDRAALDRFLPPNSPVSAINQYLSHASIDPALGNIVGRPKWAIPWLENDHSLTSPQPWVGRLRYDAADAKRLGATGLIGLHWRTGAIATNVSALAAAGWDQSYVPPEFDTSPVQPRAIPTLGAVGGINVLGTVPVAGTDIDPIYQSIRQGMTAYRLEIPNGTYRVTLQFNESTYSERGKRVFDVKIQGQAAVEKLDIFARVGAHTALDIPISEVRVADGLLVIEFTPGVDVPVVSGIVIEGKTDATATSAAQAFARKINSAGSNYAGYEPENVREAPLSQRNRALPSADFYRDFARANFGASVAEAAGELLNRLDGSAMPLTSAWIQGPGGVRIERLSPQEFETRFGFVEKWAAMRAQVRGEGNRARFSAWEDTFRATLSMARVGDTRARLDAAMNALKTETDTAKRGDLATQALAVRLELAEKWAAMMSRQVAATRTPGELGTLANLEQHSRRWLRFISSHDAALVETLGHPLPAASEPSKRYAGEPRLIVPTVRSLVAPGEKLDLKVILLARDGQNRGGSLFWRPLRSGNKQPEFRRISLKPVARSVFQATLPPQEEGAIYEYYVEADFSGRKLVYPASAPTLNQSVVVWNQSQTPFLK